MKTDRESSDRGVRIVPCEDWEDFVRQVSQKRFAGETIYRGHADASWKLASLCERYAVKFPAFRNLEVRDTYLSNFKREIARLPQRNRERTDDQFWMLGRHYGLITPLLDWTRSPFIAAFFAFTDHLIRHNERYKPGFASGAPGGIMFSAGTIAVWELSLCEKVADQPEFELLEPEIDEPNRLWAQQAVFTKLSDPKHLDLESFLASRNLGPYLRKYEIPDQAVFAALRVCQLTNIRYGTLFPDLEGAAKDVNLRHLLEVGEFMARPRHQRKAKTARKPAQTSSS